MNPKNLIYDAIYKGALNAGASERAAFDAAVMGLDAFRKNKFKSPSALVAEKIKEAKKATKLGRK